MKILKPIAVAVTALTIFASCENDVLDTQIDNSTETLETNKAPRRSSLYGTWEYVREQDFENGNLVSSVLAGEKICNVEEGQLAFCDPNSDEEIEYTTETCFAQVYLNYTFRSDGTYSSRSVESGSGELLSSSKPIPSDCADIDIINDSLESFTDRFRTVGVWRYNAKKNELAIIPKFDIIDGVKEESFEPRTFAEVRLSDGGNGLAIIDRYDLSIEDGDDVDGRGSTIQKFTKK